MINTVSKVFWLFLPYCCECSIPNCRLAWNTCEALELLVKIKTINHSFNLLLKLSLKKSAEKSSPVPKASFCSDYLSIFTNMFLSVFFFFFFFPSWPHGLNIQVNVTLQLPRGKLVAGRWHAKKETQKNQWVFCKIHLAFLGSLCPQLPPLL